MALMASDDNFSFYTSGIYAPANGECTTAVNHSGLMVGYGYDSDSADEYAIILNSWGSSWGDNGYYKMAFGIT